VGGAVLGAAFVTALPLIFQRYAGAIPFVTSAGGSGLAAGEAARYLYGAAIVLVILFLPGGLAGIPQRFRRRRAGPPAGPPSASAPDSSPQSVQSDRPVQRSTPR
jgi:branched-chain amino acid transport system permease protein